MKKAVSLILVLVICMSLCACGAGKVSQSKEVAQFAGEWESFDGKGFILLSSGKALRGYSRLEDAANKEITAMASYPGAGEWEVQGNYLIVFFENWDSGEDLAQVYKIIDNYTLEGAGVMYYRKG